MKGRKHRETGGANEAKEDEDTKPEARTDAKNIDREAEERARGGRAKGATVTDHGGSRGLAAMKKRKRGGRTEVGKVEGEHGAHHAGRKPRKAGGQTKEDREHERKGEERYEREHRATGGRTARARGGSTSDSNPFTSARKGEDAPGRKVMKGELGFGED